MNFRLANGLEVVLEENHAAPVVAFQAWVKVGSADEPPELAGISHLCEHMVFKGTERRGVGKIAQEVERAGGEINAWTSYDETAYHVVLATPFFDTGLDILADTLQNSAFDPDELDRERKVVIEEIKQGATTRTAWRRRGCSRPPSTGTHTGGPSSAAPRPSGSSPATSCSASSASTTWAPTSPSWWWATSRSTRPGERSRRPSGPCPRAARAAPSGPARAGGAPRAGGHPPGQGEPDPVRLSRALASSHEDIPALDLLAVVLGQGESSRLHLEVVRNRRLTTSASAYTFAARNPGLFVVAGSLPPGRVPARCRGPAAAGAAPDPRGGERRGADPQPHHPRERAGLRQGDRPGLRPQAGLPVGHRRRPGLRGAVLRAAGPGPALRPARGRGPLPAACPRSASTPRSPAPRRRPRGERPRARRRSAGRGRAPAPGGGARQGRAAGSSRRARAHAACGHRARSPATACAPGPGS